jgi:hypothetical protein
VRGTSDIAQDPGVTASRVAPISRMAPWRAKLARTRSANFESCGWKVETAITTGLLGDFGQTVLAADGILYYVYVNVN